MLSSNKIFQNKVQYTAPEPKTSVVFVEGNIGCGKSTFLRHFNGSNNLEVLEEPVESWTNCQGHNVMKLLYEDQCRWFSAFQSLVTLTRLKQQSMEQRAPVRMIERSLYSSRYCFTENMFQNNLIEDVELKILEDWFSWACSSAKFNVDLFIYLRAPPDVCFDRVKVRSRPEENTIPLEYLEQLHEHHENWLIKGKYGKPPAPVLVIDSNKPLQELREIYESHRATIIKDFF